MIAIQVTDLHKTFSSKGGQVRALDGLSFSVEKGEIFAFLGPNGSGKTTTLNILAHLLDSDRGTVRVLDKLPGSPGYFERISFCSGDSRYFWSSTAKDILTFYARLVGGKLSRIEVLARQFQMKEKLSRTWDALSNGEQTRIRLMIALLKEPELLFLDEPTVGLDPEAANDFRMALRQLNQNGTTIFFTSHYMKDVEDLADRVCFINQGKVHALGKVNEFQQTDGLVEIEFSSAPQIPANLGIIRDNVLLTPLHNLAQVAVLGTVVSIKMVEIGLDEYFINLAKN